MRQAYADDRTKLDQLPKLNKATIGRLLSLGKPYRKVLIFASIISLFVTAISLSLPILARAAVSGVSHRGVGALDDIASLAAILLLVSGLLTYGQFLLLALVGNRIIMETRLELFHKLQRLPVKFFDERRSGDLTSSLSNDVTLLQTSLTDDVVKVGGNVVQLIGGLVLAFVIDWRLTLVVVSMLTVTMAYFVISGIRLRRVTRSGLDALSDAMGMMTEALANIRLVKAFSREGHEDSRARVGMEKVYDLNIKASRSEGLMMAVASAGSALMLTGVVWYGGHAVIDGTISVGALLAFLIDVAIISGPMAQLAGLQTRLQRAAGAADRIFDLMDIQPETADIANPSAFPAGPGRVEFRQVEFSYVPDVPVLNRLDLVLEPDQITAIVGPSGAGKSTVASLLFRFYEPTGGEITINGQRLSTLKKSSLRESVGIVPQDTILFNGSLKQNILYGRLDASDDEVLAAVRAANLSEFVDTLPAGLETIVGERGVTLSGGQRQRVAIARVILKDPKILILDEATSALDTVSERLVKDALESLMKGRTTLVIAHRLSTIQSAHKIAVLEQGQVVESGTHTALLSTKGLYAKLYETMKSHPGMDGFETIDADLVKAPS